MMGWPTTGWEMGRGRGIEGGGRMEERGVAGSAPRTGGPDMAGRRRGKTIRVARGGVEAKADGGVTGSGAVIPRCHNSH
jgi:hypothetical protein